MSAMTANMDIEAVLRSLTLEEKVEHSYTLARDFNTHSHLQISLLAGASFWGTAAIPAKCVPSVILTDGPNGTRGVRLDGSTRAACFPAAVSIAATFDGDIAQRIGNALAEEAATKGARCLLAPTVCIQRHPLGGRNFETYSEDPLLSGTMARRMIAGIQATGTIAATIKHFVANEQEASRTTSDSRMAERTLREIYLRPFEIAVKSGGSSTPYAVMTSYNCLDGTHCDGNQRLLEGVLRGEWKWEGLVMSDWGGTNSVVESLNAGLDLEMPGPPRQRTIPAVLAAINAGDVSVETIDGRTRNVLAFLQKLGAWHSDSAGGASSSSSPVERAVDRPEHRRLIRDAGSRGIVLLKNDNAVLPLQKNSIANITTKTKPTIALIGLAKDTLAHGGGSASVRPHYKISPWDALHAALGDSYHLAYAKGFRRLRLLPSLRSHEENVEDDDADVDPNPDSLPGGTVHGLDGKAGFTLLFHDADTNGQIARPTENASIITHGHTTSSYSPVGSQVSLNKVLEIVGDFAPYTSGNHCLSCSGIGPTQVFIDDTMIFNQITNAPDPMGALFAANTEPEVRYHFEKGRTYRLRIRSHPPANLTALGLSILEGRSGARLGFLLASDRDGDESLLSEATEAAASADIAIVFTGHDPQWETEGRDQDSFNLPRTQDAVVNAVADAAPVGKTIVVNSTGTPVAMPWLSQVGAVLQTWFPGQECGNAIADVLTGAINPEGHLPVSFPRRIEDAPAHGHFGAGLDDPKPVVDYVEGVFVGYRFYDRAGASLLNFPFGHGLSYTTFDIGTPKVDFQDKGMYSTASYTVTVPISNRGSVYGGVALQLYIGRASLAMAATTRFTIPPPADAHPIKTLIAYKKVRLAPGATKEVTLTAPVRDFAYFDDVHTQQWLVEPGIYRFYCGFSATDTRHVANVILEKRFIYNL